MVAIFSLSAIAYATILAEIFPDRPKLAASGEILWLDQGWTDEEREQYYRTSQGSMIMPYSWFLALEQPEANNRELFSSPENLARYGLVPGAASKYNPDRLPIGLTRQTIPNQYFRQLACGAPTCPPGSILHSEWLSYTCAACHTSQIVFHGKRIGIDGGRGIWNFAEFNRALGGLLFETAMVPGMFDRFAARVLKFEGQRDQAWERQMLRAQLQDFLRGPRIVNTLVAGVKGIYPTEEGYGRIDAFGRGANGQFAPLDARNIARANAPVLIPPLWYTHDYDWVQSVAAIRQPMGRNITQSWGVLSAIDLSNPDSSKRFASTIVLAHMYWMETLVSVLMPPPWPEQILGKIDREAAERGRYLYEEKIYQDALSPAEEQWCPGARDPSCPNAGRPQNGLCARCHGAALEPHADRHGKRYWQLPLYKLDVIGTDPLDAINFSARRVYTGNLRAQFNGREQVSLGEALQVTTSGIMTREFEKESTPLEERPLISGDRDNEFRAPLAYPARPLQGYWATPPYLHNGSVPSLYELLSPASERSATFWTGTPEYDPVRVGYRSSKFAGGFRYETKRSTLVAAGYSLREIFSGHLDFKRDVDGNSNLGHVFSNAPKGTKGVIGPFLTPSERRDIIEYMKMMPAMIPGQGVTELNRRRETLQGMEAQYQGTPREQSVAENHGGR